MQYWHVSASFAGRWGWDQIGCWVPGIKIIKAERCSRELMPDTMQGHSCCDGKYTIVTITTVEIGSRKKVLKCPSLFLLHTG